MANVARFEWLATPIFTLLGASECGGQSGVNFAQALAIGSEFKWCSPFSKRGAKRSVFELGSGDGAIGGAGERPVGGCWRVGRVSVKTGWVSQIKLVLLYRFFGYRPKAISCINPLNIDVNYRIFPVVLDLLSVVYQLQRNRSPSLLPTSSVQHKLKLVPGICSKWSLVCIICRVRRK